MRPSANGSCQFSADSGMESSSLANSHPLGSLGEMREPRRERTMRFGRTKPATTFGRFARRWTAALKTRAKEFCLATGLHGYKYIARDRRSKTERIVWAVIVLSSLCCAVALMRIAWAYCGNHPTLTVIESTHHGIWYYPFPAVTVCDVNRVSLGLAEEFLGELDRNNFSRDFLIGEMRLLNELLDPGVFGYDVTKNLTRLQAIFDASGYTIPQIIRRVTRNCSSLVTACKWRGANVRCEELFEPSWSRDGLCCSFNYLKSRRVESTPLRIAACGYQTGLSVSVNPEPRDYLASIFGSHGVKISLHSPYDYPDHSAEGKLVDTGLQVFMSVSPEETYSTDAVRKVPVALRGCVFGDERIAFGAKDSNRERGNLATAEYSYVNCLAQCRAMTIRAKCRCVPYYLPQNGARICNLTDVSCLFKYKSWYETSWPGIDPNREALERSRSTVIPARPCGCMPDCTLYRYPVESSSGILGRNGNERLSFSRGARTRNESTVHIFFNDLVSIRYRRDVYCNWQHVFASFGGLLGLFAGFSLMNGFEFIYFFVIRAVFDDHAGRNKKNATPK